MMMLLQVFFSDEMVVDLNIKNVAVNTGDDGGDEDYGDDDEDDDGDDDGDDDDDNGDDDDYNKTFENLC